MSAPSKAYAFQLVKIQPGKRLTTFSESNFAPSLVTGCREAKERGYRAITQVKGLSPEITISQRPKRFIPLKAVSLQPLRVRFGDSIGV